jgi:ornithine carbamoyltransferase
MFAIKRLLINNSKIIRYCSSTTTLAGKHFMNISQLSAQELDDLILHAIRIKESWSKDPINSRKLVPLHGMSMSMIFQKRSTRTRVSTETGIFMLGGHALMLGPSDIQLGVNESMRDTSNVLARYNDIILARVFAHKDVEELAKYSKVPVINALSDKYHPLQTLADLMTLKEHFGNDLKGLKLAWVGDGNNVFHDLMIGSIKQGMSVSCATPKGYEPDSGVVKVAKKLAKEHEVKLKFTNDPLEAVKGANVIVTDTWVSMGEESKAAQKKLDFKGYQVNTAMMKTASKNAVFLHCLPRKPEEVDDKVFYSEKSLVFPEAENRMWTVMAVALELLGKKF